MEIGTVEKNVLVGCENNLFLFSGSQKSFSYSTGELSPEESSLVNFLENIKTRKKILDERETPFVHVIFPSKEVVLKDKTPWPYCETIQSLFLNNYQKIIPESIRSAIVYPLLELSAVNLKNRVFRILDTHMTDIGSLTVVGIVLKKFGIDVELNKCIEKEEVERSGDLAVMLGAKHKTIETVFNTKIKFFTYDNRQYLPGNTNNVTIQHNPNSVLEKRVLIFGDSFIKCCLNYLSLVFRDVVYIRDPALQVDMLELLMPDFVITSTAERYLCHVNSDNDTPPLYV